ncbi:MAG: hypothetical protein U0575_03315 [Phycisphaerales bacterium]
MKMTAIALLPTALLAAALTGCSTPKDATAPAAAPQANAASSMNPPLTTTESAEFTVTATVQAINLATREVTLKDTSGHEVTFVVDNAVRRLDEVKVGDQVTADFFVSVVGELRPPTPEEAANPLMAVAVAGRAAQGTDPGAAAARGVRVVTTVQAVDLPNMTVTLQGPMGDHATIRAKSLENLKKLHVGDTIVVTYTEAMAVSLEKVAPRM